MAAPPAGNMLPSQPDGMVRVNGLIPSRAIRARPIRELAHLLPDPPLQAVVVPAVLLPHTRLPKSIRCLGGYVAPRDDLLRETVPGFLLDSGGVWPARGV
ncbi:hypothetical protein ARTHRO9V_280209 [Arthrobacter sp. 9V]|nr:hypothetical protein ARTHRO9V_280209 [Arthrobacter sp. 9V]